MAFHLACPLTCRKICYCSFGGGREREGGGGDANKKKSPSSWATALKLEEIYATAAANSARFPWHVVPFEQGKTVDVLVPSLVKDVKKNKRSRILDGRENNSSNGNVVNNNSEEGVPTRVAKKAFRGSSGGKSMAFSAATGGAIVGINPISTTRLNAEQRTNKKKKVSGGGGGVSSTAAAKFRASNGSRQVMDAKTVARSFAPGVGGPSTAATTTRAEQQQQQQQQQQPALGRHGSKGALPTPFGGEDTRQQSSSSLLPRPVCGLCASAEGGGKDRMLSCRGCNRKYHKNCVQNWAQFRDLFDWNSWVCASCRFCEVCRQAGEANKLMFCKRCDNALHTYCQQPPLKHVPKGPYLCPKHTMCHSCSSNVPGSGMSSKWFMAFTTCDACGRLFAKEKYCPVCLKVYRDSEATPMVRCDSCEHWVHCKCDGISDEMFDRYQSEDDLRYECAACRGECHKVTGMEDAIRELWKRRDAQYEAEQRLKLGSGAAAATGGMSSRDKRNHTDNISPSDDDDDDDAEEKQAERPGGEKMRQTIIVQRNSSLKGPRQKWLPKSQQKRGEPRQKLLSSVVL